MKIVFLDFDGVLNSWDDVENDRSRRPGIIPLYERPTLLLHALCHDTSARVVVSSSWRLLHDLDELRGFLGAKGFPREWVIDLTPSTSTVDGQRRPYACRGDEIQAWLDQHPEVTRYVAIDDDGLGRSGGEHPVTTRLVRTTFAWGLRGEHVERAMEMLQ